MIILLFKKTTFLAIFVFCLAVYQSRQVTVFVILEFVWLFGISSHEN